MTLAERWVQKAYAQRVSLENELNHGSLRRNRLWRLMVLEGRCSQAYRTRLRTMLENLGYSPLAPEKLESLITDTVVPTHAELLEELTLALQATEPPDGTLMDTLLEIDDCSTVETLIGNRTEAMQLITSAVTLVQQHSERTRSLCAWAHMRRQSLSPADPSALLWQSIVNMEVHQQQLAEVTPASKLRPYIDAVYARIAVQRRLLPSEIGLSRSSPHISELLEARLGPLSPSGNAVGSLSWGELRSLHLRLGEEIHLSLPATAEKLRIGYKHSKAEGFLGEEHGWRLEPGEAPVMLLVLAGGSTSSSVSEALSSASSVAGLLLLETKE